MQDFAQPPPPVTTMKGKHALENSLHQFHPTIAPQPAQTDNFYQLSKHIEREVFVQPETESTYNIFYRKQVQNRVPVLENNCKKEESNRIAYGRAHAGAKAFRSYEGETRRYQQPMAS